MDNTKKPSGKTQSTNEGVLRRTWTRLLSRLRTLDWRRILDHGMFAIGLVFNELVFKTSTTGEFVPQLAFVALFSIAVGMLLELALSFVRAQKCRRRARITLLAAGGVVFSIEYFVYRAFKHFYDLKTVTAGAADAATGFTGIIVTLVFSPTGILHIVLFLAPAIFLGVLYKRGLLDCDATHSEDAKHLMHVRMGLGSSAIVAHALALVLIVASGSLGQTYSERYSFQSAVTNFGLMTGIRKDFANLVSGADATVSFDTNEAPKTKEPAPSAEPQAQQKTFGKSELPLDFNALSSQANNTTWAELDRYVASLTPSSQNEMTGRFKGYNLILISAEAFSSEAIREDLTPTLYRLATKGIQFTDYYQFDSAGTTGGECNNLFGLTPTEGGDSVKITADHNNYLTMGNALNRLGYNGWAFHNNTFTYYSRDKTHNNLGYNNGFMGYGNGMEKYVTWQWPQSDLEMMKGTFDDLYGNEQSEPFNVYYMSVSGHSGYAPGENAMSDKHWDAVKDLPYSDPVKGYLACNIEFDKALEYLVAKLEEKKMADHTVIVIGADHFPYGLDDDGPLGHLPMLSELYGYDVRTYFERDHNRLIIWSGALEKEQPLVVSEPTCAVDILPTLLNLFGCEWDSRLLCGRDVFSDKPALAYDPSYDWKSALGTYYAGTGEFVPNEGVQVPEGYVEATNADVANRITYAKGVLTSDYYRHVFGEAQDVHAVHDAAAQAR